MERPYTMREACEYISRKRGKNMSRSRLAELAIAGRVQGAKTSGGMWLFEEAALDRLIRSIRPYRRLDDQMPAEATG